MLTLMFSLFRLLLFPSGLAAESAGGQVSWDPLQVLPLLLFLLSRKVAQSEGSCRAGGKLLGRREVAQSEGSCWAGGKYLGRREVVGPLGSCWAGGKLSMEVAGPEGPPSGGILQNSPRGPWRLQESPCTEHSVFRTS